MSVVQAALVPTDRSDTLVIMASAAQDYPLVRWDPRRRTALENVPAVFKAAGGDQVSLSDDLVAERRLAAAAEDGIAPGDPAFGLLLELPALGVGSATP